MEVYDAVRNFDKLCHMRTQAGGFKLPTFIGVGAARCGTSSLYSYLSVHPDVYMSPVKEINYFAIRSASVLPPGRSLNLEMYSLFFAGREQQTHVGEISPVYLSRPGACDEIAAELGTNVKIIILIRDPIDRFVSHYQHHLPRLKTENFSHYVQEAFDNFGHRQWQFHWYAPSMNLLQSLYATSIKKYLATFGQENVLVIRYENLKQPEVFTQQICAFLGIEFKRIYLRRENRSRTTIQVTNEERNRLRAFFLDDIAETAQIIQQDLSTWMPEEK